MDQTRVQHIKQKFEDNTCKVKSESSKILLDNFNMIASELSDYGRFRSETSEIKNANIHRSNVKRTPAFRRDKICARNVTKDNDENMKCSMVTSRIHHFNNLHDINDSGPLQTYEPNNTKIFKKTAKHFEEKFNSKLENVHSNNLNSIYSKIKKKKVTNKKSTTEGILRNISPVNPTNHRKHLKPKTEFEDMKKKHKIYSEIKRGSKNDKGEELSDALKRILRLPLPTGPPPEKPPRIFNSKKSEINNVNEPSKSIEIREENTNENIQKQLFDSESEMKLKKIEKALLNHQQKFLRSPFSTKKHLNPSTDFSNIKDELNNVESENQNLSINSFNSDSSSKFNNSVEHSSPDIKNPPNDEHIYDVPDKLNMSQSSEKTNPSSLYYMSTPIISLRHSPKNSSNKNTITSPKFGSVHCTSDSMSVENKIKMWMNEAYSEPMTKVSDSSDSDSIASVNQNKEPKNPSDDFSEVTLRRKGYVQKVASKTVSRQPTVLIQDIENCNCLFDCLFLIGLDLDSCNNKVPYIKMKYPDNVEIPKWTENMCFPDAHDWFKGSSDKNVIFDDKTNRCYVVYLMTKTGQRKYVYCRRIKPEGEEHFLPLTYCILSYHKASYFYFSILEEIELRHGQSNTEFNKFIKELYNNKFPTRGYGVKINLCTDDGNEIFEKELVRRPLDSRLEDLQLAKTLSFLKMNIFIYIFASMLLERKIILLSSSISKLSTCIEGLQIALLPFEWQHTLITMVPSTIISVGDLCEAPTPYLIGLYKSKNISEISSPFSNLQQLVVDLDEGKILQRIGDENSILPSHLAKGIKNALQLAHSSEINANNLLACEAFTRLFVELIGHYRRFIVTNENDFNKSKSFEKKLFLKETSTHSVRMFLEWFVETAAFSAFIEEHLSNNFQPNEIFEQRCEEYSAELNKLKYLKANKINKTVKHIGDMLKDFI